MRLMRAAGLVVAEAHQAAAERIRAGVTTREVDDAVAEVFRKHSAEPLGSSYAIALSACRRSGRLDMLPRVLQAAVEHSERRPGWLCTDELHSELVRDLALRLSSRGSSAASLSASLTGTAQPKKSCSRHSSA